MACYLGLHKWVDVILASETVSPSHSIQDASRSITDRQSALHFAVLGGSYDMIKYLLDNNTSPDIPAASGITPLQYAALRSQSRNLKLLLSYSNDVNSLLGPCIEHANVEALETAILAGADLNSSLGNVSVHQSRRRPPVCHRGVTSLHMAVLAWNCWGRVLEPHSYSVVVRLLLSYNADPTIEDDDGMTAIQHATTPVLRLALLELYKEHEYSTTDVWRGMAGQ